VASTLLAALEMARDGKVELQQLAPFAEIFVRDGQRGPDLPTPEAFAPGA
jgi:chromatin segregation and condensation protein Rec8/ScpA/Scc1 (kleisin family)